MANETKWTPGPYSEPSPYGLLGFEIQAQGRSIAVVNRVDSTRLSHLHGKMDAKAKRGEPGYDEAREAKEIEGRATEALATARLFSAAPDLYAALEGALPFLSILGVQRDPEVLAATDAVRAALRRARGEE